MLKIDGNTGRTQDRTARGFVTCLAHLSIILCYSDSHVFKKGCLKSFLNAKVKSLMIKCINQGFRSDGQCQCRCPHCRLLRAAVLWPMCFARTAYSHWFITNGPAATIAIDTDHEYSSKENWTTNIVVYEINNFIEVFWINFAGEKKIKIQGIISLVLLRVQSYFKHQVKEQNLFW